MSYQDMNPNGTTAQNALLFQGRRAVVAAPILAFASLANGQTFVTITPAIAADSRTINAALAASTDRPTFCAALALELNAANTTAYIWTVNGTSDGLIGTAKLPGSRYNVLPTGTCLDPSGSLAVTTYGTNPNDTSGLETIGIWEPRVAASAMNFTVNPNDWDYLEVLSSQIGGATEASTLRADGVDGGWSNGGYIINAVGQASINHGSDVLVSVHPAMDANFGWDKICMTKISGGWAVEVEAVAKGTTELRTSWTLGFMPAFTTYFQRNSSAAIYRVGSRVVLKGRRS